MLCRVLRQSSVSVPLANFSFIITGAPMKQTATANPNDSWGTLKRTQSKNLIIINN